MKNFILRPSIDLYPGIQVTKETKLEFKNEHVEQKIEDLVFHSIAKVKGDGYESVYDTTIQLLEGDILIFEEEARGYIKPVERMCTIQEAIDEFENMKDLG